MIKHGLVTKHVDVVLSGPTVSNMFEWTEVLQCLSPKEKMVGHQTMFDPVWLPNISRLDSTLLTNATWIFKLMPSSVFVENIKEI